MIFYNYRKKNTGKTRILSSSNWIVINIVNNILHVYIHMTIWVTCIKIIKLLHYISIQVLGINGYISKTDLYINVQ